MTGAGNELGRTPLRIVQIVAVALVAFHFVHLAFAPVFMDEAYYWMWGQHPALSYYDHPPLDAWLLGLSSTVFGWTIGALRLPVALSFSADIVALYLLSRQVARQAWPSHFAVTLLLFVATPIYWTLSAYALPDHLLLCFTLFAIYFFLKFFMARSEGGEGRTRDLLVGALFLGLAGLAKYNAAFLALGVVAFVLLYDRRLLRDGRLYLAAAVTLALQLPAIVWNISENFASFEFILYARHAGIKTTIDGLVPLALGILIFISPFLVWPIVKFAFRREAIPAGAGFARATFAISTLGIFAVALTTVVLFHWNLVAYAAMLPFLALVMRPRWLLVGQAIYGAVFAAFVFTNYAIVPLSQVNAWRDGATAWSYGWAPTVAAIAQARKDHPVGFIAAGDYTTASLVGFMTGDRDVTSLYSGRDEFDYWFDPAAHKGEDALLFGDTWRPIYRDVSEHFKTMTEIATLPIVVFGRKIDVHHLYLATDYDPNG